MSSSSRLADLSFVDLYIGKRYADIKGQPGAHAERVAAGRELDNEIDQVRGLCSDLHEKHGEPEFAMLHDKVLYRVTVMHDVLGEPVYFLRRMAAEIRDFERIGIPNSLSRAMIDKTLRGLILIAGDMANGKTTTAASLIACRLRMHGGLALSIEDPPETLLDGLHGEGRCIQIPASHRHGHYREQLRRAMRTGVSTLGIGEIRCRDTAGEAIRQSLNGLTVISTIHAKDPVDALSRLIALTENSIENPQKLLAQGLHSVVYQKLDRASSGVVRASFRWLQTNLPDATGIRSKIANNDLSKLLQDVDNQSRSATWT